MKNLPARGYRNNNPGNIEHNPRNQWQGLNSPPTDGRFCRFVSPVDGIRALARVLIRYFDAHKAADGTPIDTIEEVIARWAPAFENNVRAYVSHVDKIHPKAAMDVLNLHDYDDLEPLVRGIIRHELGDPMDRESGIGKAEWYPQDVIDEGLRRAGVVRRHQRVREQPETKAAAAVATGTATAVGGGAYAYVEVQRAASDLRDAGRAQIEAGNATSGAFMVVAGVLIIVIGLAALGFITYKRLKRSSA